MGVAISVKEDKLDLLDRIKMAKARTANRKSCISDEFSEACDALIVAERKFDRLDGKVRTDSSADVCKWFDALEERYLAEKRVWQLFTAGERSRRMGMLYLRFRESLFTGLPLRADA
jgi:glutathione S-transferase